MFICDFFKKFKYNIFIGLVLSLQLKCTLAYFTFKTTSFENHITFNSYFHKMFSFLKGAKKMCLKLIVVVCKKKITRTFSKASFKKIEVEKKSSLKLRTN